MADKLLVATGENELYADLVSILGARSVAMERLDTGDLYWYAHGGTVVGGERKRADDLIASIVDDRLYDELQRMKDYDQRHLFVVGELYPWGGGTLSAYGQLHVKPRPREALRVEYSSYHRHDVDYLRVQAVLQLVATECGVTIWFDRTERLAAGRVAGLWTRRDRRVEPRLWHPDVELIRRDPVAAAYLTVDHVGKSTAMALAKRFPRERDLAAATDEDIRSVEGVGPVRLKALRERYGHVLGA